MSWCGCQIRKCVSNLPPRDRTDVRRELLSKALSGNGNRWVPWASERSPVRDMPLDNTGKQVCPWHPICQRCPVLYRTPRPRPRPDHDHPHPFSRTRSHPTTTTTTTTTRTALWLFASAGLAHTRGDLVEVLALTTVGRTFSAKNLGCSRQGDAAGGLVEGLDCPVHLLAVRGRIELRRSITRR